MKINLTKRQKIIIVSILVTLGLLSTQLADFNWRFRLMMALSGLACALSFWALRPGLNLIKSIALLILPTLYTLAVASFYFLLPVRWLTRLPVAIFFGLTFYLLLLVQNVFNVAAIRTIPLYRAASTAAFMFTLITAFFIYNVIHAFNLFFIWNGLLVMLISLPLILQIFWSVDMKDYLSSHVLAQSFILSLGLGELGVAFSFWPMATTIWSLSLATAMYVLVGLTTHMLRDRWSRRVVWEYLAVGGTFLILAFLTTPWTG